MVSDNAGTVTYQYDDAGSRTSEVRDAGSATFTTTYAYDANGNVTTINPPGIVAVTITYDEANRETSADWHVSLGSGTIYDQVEWAPFATWTEHAPSGSTLRSVRRPMLNDESGRLNLSAFSYNTTDLERMKYTYALDGNPKWSSNLNASTQNADLAHDSLGRLRQGRSGEYTYDDAGNRMSGPGGDLTYPVDTENKWSDAESGSIDYTFDDAGRVTERDPGTPYTIHYTEEGWVDYIQENNQGSKQTDYVRDYRGLRFSKAGWGGSSTYTHDPQGRLLEWQGPGQNMRECWTPGWPGTWHFETHIPFETFVYLGGQRVAIVKSHYESGNYADCGTQASFHLDDVYHLVNDKMGQTIGIRRASDWKAVWQADLDEWGNPIEINENPESAGTYAYSLRLPGQMALTQKEGGGALTDGGLVENWHRMYDSQIGRYAQLDPIDAAKWDPQGRNRYAYVGNAALLYVDPDGQIRVKDLSQHCCGPQPVKNNFSHGLMVARAAATLPKCRAYFRDLYGEDIAQLLSSGGRPQVVLGLGKRGTTVSQYYDLLNTIRIPCNTLSKSPTYIAAALIHELGHYADDTAVPFGVRSRIRLMERPDGVTLKRGQFDTPSGYGAEMACFGRIP